MLVHEINHECYKCICRVCGQAGCPHRTGWYKRCVRCWENHKCSPILDCKNFYLKYFPKYRIKRIYKRPKIRYVDKTNADDVRIMLTEILRILRPESAVSHSDINCVKNECICLSCPLSHACADRCGNCREYKGQYPVRMCGKRLQIAGKG